MRNVIRSLVGQGSMFSCLFFFFFLVKHVSLCCVHNQQIEDLSTVKQTPAWGKGDMVKLLTPAELMHLLFCVVFGKQQTLEVPQILSSV